MFLSCYDLRVPNRFFGTRDFPYLKLRIRDFKALSGRYSGLKVCFVGRMPKITLGITGLQNPIEDPLICYGGPPYETLVTEPIMPCSQALPEEREAPQD